MLYSMPDLKGKLQGKFIKLWIWAHEKKSYEQNLSEV